MAVVLVNGPQTSLIVLYDGVSVIVIMLKPCLKTDLVAKPGDLASAAHQQRLTCILAHLATGMAAWLVEAARCAGLIVVQSIKKLPLAWAAEGGVPKGKREGLVALNLARKSAKVLEIMLFNLRTSAHHHCTQNDEFVLGLVLLEHLQRSVVGASVAGAVCEAAELADELAPKTSVELLAHTFQR